MGRRGVGREFCSLLPLYLLMSLLPSAVPAAILLVFLPLPTGGQALAERWRPSLGDLQQQLGLAVRVLAIAEASHPAVVRSFGLPALPACVLMRQGVELWRQSGLPTAETLLAMAQAG
jgi:hypothetical protein